MFINNTYLTNIDNLILSADTLANGCYYRMFEGCSKLSSIPQNLLPATTLTSNCYYGMFYGCTALSTAPYLPATELGGACYNYMFRDCTNLSSIEVAFTSWPPGWNPATYYWLSNVAPTGIFIKPRSLSISRGTDRIPSNWTILNRINGNLYYAEQGNGSNVPYSP